jgi:hypothetical protein
VSPSTAWSRRWPARGRVVACGPVPAADRPTQRPPGGASGRCPRRRAPPWSGRPSCPPHRPLPFLVHRWCPPGPVPRPVRCPAVRCPAVRCPAVRCPTVGCPVTWLRRPGPTCPAVWCRPSGGQLPGVRPSVLWRLSRPGSARRGPWERAGPAGPSRLEWIGFRVACRLPERLGRRLRGLDAGDPAEVMGSSGGGVSIADLAGLRSSRGGRARLLTDQGLAWPGAARRRRLPLAGTRGYPPWSLSSLTPEWTGLEGQ